MHQIKGYAILCGHELNVMSPCSNTACWHGTVMLKTVKTRMWVDAQCDGRPAEYRWCLCSMPQSLADAQYWSAVQ